LPGKPAVFLELKVDVGAELYRGEERIHLPVFNDGNAAENAVAQQTGDEFIYWHLRGSQQSAHNSHSTQHTRAKQNSLRFIQTDTPISKTCSERHITPKPTPRSVQVIQVKSS
jgi:hypothetical protein